jgi:hypothetical protein
LECECPLNEMELEDRCVCKPGFHRDQSNLCICPELEEPLFESCVCLQISGMVRDPNGNCSCPANSQLIDGVCQCKANFTSNNSTHECECPANEVLVNGTCLCKEGLVRYSDRCDCPPTEIMLANGECVCREGFVFDKASDGCVCPELEILRNGYCQCRPMMIRNTTSQECQCPPGYSLRNGACYDTDGTDSCPDNETYDETLGECVCNDGYSRNNSTGACELGKNFEHSFSSFQFSSLIFKFPFEHSFRYFNLQFTPLRGVVVALSGLRDRGPGFKTRSVEFC